MPASIQSKIQIVIDVTSDATAGQNYVVPRGGTVIGVTVIATATNGGGTLTVGKGGSAITSALACATANAVTAAATLNQSNVVFAAGDSIRVTSNGAADRGRAIVDFLVDASPSLAAA